MINSLRTLNIVGPPRHRCHAAGHSPPRAGAPPSRAPGGGTGRGAHLTRDGPANHGPRRSPWSASGAVFLPDKLFDGEIRSGGSSHFSSVESSGLVGRTVHDEA
jgi:hypothetical protein